MLLTLLKTFAPPQMTKVGRTVPAERANPLLITLFPPFNELLTRRGAEGPVSFFFFVVSFLFFLFLLLSACLKVPTRELSLIAERKAEKRERMC